MRILVVEDDSDLRRQLADVLSQSGYAVDLAADGAEVGVEDVEMADVESDL